jgi:hypothetical protein
MFKFSLGFITGVYVAQRYRDKVPDITKIVDGIIADVKKKIDEYNNK